MSWSANLQAYLSNAGATYTFAALHTIDGSSCFGECGGEKKNMTQAEIAQAIKTVSGDSKTSGITLGGDKYVYLIDDGGVFCFKKTSKACLFFYGANFTFTIFSDTEPRVLLGSVQKVKQDLADAGLA